MHIKDVCLKTNFARSDDSTNSAVLAIVRKKNFAICTFAAKAEDK